MIFIEICVYPCTLAVVWVPCIGCHFLGSVLKKGNYPFSLPLPLNRVRARERSRHTPIENFREYPLGVQMENESIKHPISKQPLSPCSFVFNVLFRAWRETIIFQYKSKESFLKRQHWNDTHVSSPR